MHYLMCSHKLWNLNHKKEGTGTKDVLRGIEMGNLLNVTMDMSMMSTQT